MIKISALVKKNKDNSEKNADTAAETNPRTRLPLRVLTAALAALLTAGLLPAAGGGSTKTPDSLSDSGVLRASAASKPDASSLDCWGSAVIDAETGEMLWGSAPDYSLVPASMTKMMTAFVVYEAIRDGQYTMDSPVKVSSSVAKFSTSGTWSNVPLYANGVYTVRQLMKAMMVESACGAAKALAEFTSGSESAFADRMNAEAAALQMDAEFHDSYGGSASNKMTPRAVATLGRALVIYHPEILEITGEKSFQWYGITYHNTNRFVRGFYNIDGASIDGLKTGTTTAAGKCLCSTGYMNGRRVVAVVMKEDSTAQEYADSKALLTYGFDQAENYSPRDMVARYGDVDEGDWYAAAVKSMNSRGLMGGVSEFSFRPDSQVTRAMMAQILYNYADKPAVYSSSSYTDVSDQSWYSAAVAWCRAAGVAYGTTAYTFEPEVNITREEMILMLYRYAVSTGAADESKYENTADQPDVLNAFSDRDEIDDYAEAAMRWAVSNGYINGTGDGKLEPQAESTRAQAAQFLTKIVG